MAFSFYYRSLQTGLFVMVNNKTFTVATNRAISGSHALLELSSTVDETRPPCLPDSMATVTNRCYITRDYLDPQYGKVAFWYNATYNNNTVQLPPSLLILGKALKNTALPHTLGDMFNSVSKCFSKETGILFLTYHQTKCL